MRKLLFQKFEDFWKCLATHLAFVVRNSQKKTVRSTIQLRSCFEYEKEKRDEYDPGPIVDS